MVWALGTLLIVALVASSLIRARMFVFRHDEKWRRSRGALFGAAPLGLWWHDVYRNEDYSPEGQRLIPAAMILEGVSIVLAILTFMLIVRAA